MPENAPRVISHMQFIMVWQKRCPTLTQTVWPLPRLFAYHLSPIAHVDTAQLTFISFGRAVRLLLWTPNGLSSFNLRLFWRPHFFLTGSVIWKSKRQQSRTLPSLYFWSFSLDTGVIIRGSLSPVNTAHRLKKINKYLAQSCNNYFVLMATSTFNNDI